jgi:hypothetical protein
MDMDLVEVDTRLPEGSSVRVLLDNGSWWHTKTRSLPWKLGDRWVVLLSGRAGGYDLTRVRKAKP